VYNYCTVSTVSFVGGCVCCYRARALACYSDRVVTKAGVTRENKLSRVLSRASSDDV